MHHGWHQTSGLNPTRPVQTFVANGEGSLSNCFVWNPSSCSCTRKEGRSGRTVRRQGHKQQPGLQCNPRCLDIFIVVPSPSACRSGKTTWTREGRKKNSHRPHGPGSAYHSTKVDVGWGGKPRSKMSRREHQSLRTGPNRNDGPHLPRIQRHALASST